MAGMVRSPAWLLALAVLCGGGPEARGHCGEQERCRDLGSTDSILECIQLCKFDITGESPVYPGYENLQPPGEADHTYGKTPFLAELPGASLAGQQVEEGALGVLLETLSSVEEEEPEPGHDDKRSYPMEHFRWGKPVGRKRRPVKVYSNGIEEDLSEAYPTEMRRELPDQPDYVLGEGEPSLGEKRDGSYKMNHFRWGGPPQGKRYGGFMKSWGGHSQKPLLTLFKNVIIKDGHQKKDQ